LLCSSRASRTGAATRLHPLRVTVVLPVGPESLPAALADLAGWASRLDRTIGGTGLRVRDHTLNGYHLTVRFLPRDRTGWPDRARLIAIVFREMAA
jgi:hypothetical protein